MSRMTLAPVVTRDSARVVGMPSAASDSLAINSRTLLRSTARPSADREYGVSPAPCAVQSIPRGVRKVYPNQIIACSHMLAKEPLVLVHACTANGEGVFQGAVLSGTQLDKNIGPPQDRHRKPQRSPAPAATAAAVRHRLQMSRWYAGLPSNEHHAVWMSKHSP